MTPYEMMLSESQERMLLVAERGREQEVLAVFRKWGLDAVEIGAVTAGGILRVRHHGRVAAEIPAHALAEQGPVYQRPLAAPAERNETAAGNCSNSRPEGADLTGNFRKLARRAGDRFQALDLRAVRHMVRTNTLAVPGAGDAAVVRIKGNDGTRLTRALGAHRRQRPLVLARSARWRDARGCRSRAQRRRRRRAPWAATNCLNFGNPEKPEVMWQFSEAIDGIAEACRALAIPITGGNVSFYNDTLGKSIDPTPVLGVLGVLEDASSVLKHGFRAEGDVILLLDGRARTPRRARRCRVNSDERSCASFPPPNTRARSLASSRRATGDRSRRRKAPDRSARGPRQRGRACVRARYQRRRPGRPPSPNPASSVAIAGFRSLTYLGATSTSNDTPPEHRSLRRTRRARHRLRRSGKLTCPRAATLRHNAVWARA